MELYGIRIGIQLIYIMRQKKKGVVTFSSVKIAQLAELEQYTIVDEEGKNFKLK